MSGGGIIIQRRAEIQQVVSPGTAIYGSLPSICQGRIDSINLKALSDWTDDEESFMASMPTVAVHC